MGFRDEDASRRAKVDALIAEREANEERLDALEARLAAAEATLKSLEKANTKDSGPKAKPAKEKPAKPSPKSDDDAQSFQRQWRTMFVIGGLAVAGCFVGMFWQLRAPDVPPPPAMVEPPAPAPPVPAPDPAPQTIDIAEMLRAAANPPPPSTDSAPRALFTGTVVEASGNAPAPTGASCEVHVSTENLLYTLPPDELRIRCAGHDIYAFVGETPCEVFGQAEVFGGLFALSCEDRGLREDRPEVVLRSIERELRIWSENFEWSIRVELERRAARVPLRRALDRPNSLPLQSAQRLSLRVQERTGEGAPAINRELTLRVQPSRRYGRNCDFQLRDGRRLIGRAGGSCILNEQLELIGVQAELQAGESLGLTLARNQDSLSVDSADGERSWRIVTQVLREE